jgi:hypothetical protein
MDEKENSPDERAAAWLHTLLTEGDRCSSSGDYRIKDTSGIFISGNHIKEAEELSKQRKKLADNRIAGKVKKQRMPAAGGSKNIETDLSELTAALKEKLADE